MRTISVFTVVVALLGAAIFPFRGSAQPVDVKDAYFKYDSKKYFRKGAASILVGSYGEKKTPLTEINYLEKKGDIKRDELRTIVYLGQVPVSYSKEIEAEFMSEIKTDKFGMTRSAFLTAFKEGKLVLAYFKVEYGHLKRAINKGDSRTRNAIKDEGRKGRVVSEIFVVVEADFTSSLSLGGKYEVKGSTEDMTVTFTSSASGSASSEIEYSLPMGTTFAYMLVKPEWDGDTVIDFEDDFYGLY